MTAWSSYCHSSFYKPMLTASDGGLVFCQYIEQSTSIICVCLQIELAQSDADYFATVDEIGQLVDLAGCSALAINKDNAQQLVDNICHFVFVGCLGPVIQQ